MDRSEENKRLRRELEEKNQRLKKLQETVDELLFDEQEDQKDVKILQLAKKNRGLLMKLNKERGKTAQLQKELDMMQKKKKKGPQEYRHYVSGGRGKTKFEPSSPDSTPTPSLPDPELIIRKHQKRYERLSAKFHESKQECVMLKTKIKRLKKYLDDECGGEDYKKLGWKGRSQQIIVLKDQISRLREHIPKGRSGPGLSSRRNVKMGPTLAVHEELKQVSVRRKEELDRTKKQLESVEDKNMRLKHRKKALESRVSILERQQSEHKMKTERIIQKTLNDNKLIALLKQKIQSLKKKNGSPSTPKRSSPRTQDRRLRERLNVLEQELLDKTEKLSIAEKQIRKYLEQRRKEEGEEEEEKKDENGMKKLRGSGGEGMRRALLGFELDRKDSYLKELKDRVLELEDRVVKVNRKLVSEKQEKERYRKKWESNRNGGNSPMSIALDLDVNHEEDEMEYLKNEKEILEENLVNLRKKWKSEVEMYQDIIMKQREKIEVLSKKKK